MNRILPLILLVLLALPLAAQQTRLEKSPRHAEWANVKSGEREIRSFIVYPEKKEKAVAVLVIHENKGLTDWVRAVADQLAEAGYVAIAPDLLSGIGPKGGGTGDFSNEDAAREAIYKLEPNQVVSDLNAVADYALKLPASNGKLAVAGFCWGGGQSLRYATRRADLKAAFVFYGSFDYTKDDVARIACPVYGFYAGNDERVSGTIPATTSAMKDAGKKYEPVVYEGAGHGFMRAGEDPQGTEADRKAHGEAWERLLKILKAL